jgi:16S rRNA processing protein RimM
MGRRDPRFLVVGHLNKPHGTKGEVFVWPLTDHPESVYAPGVVLYTSDEDDGEHDDDAPPLRIRAVREFRNGYLVSFEGVHGREGAEHLCGRYVVREIDALPPLEEGEVFYHQLLGMEVVTTEGKSLGEVAEVYELRPADLLEVRGPYGSIMIPFLSHIVVDVDAAAGRMVIDPPEGLLDLSSP